MPRPVADAPRAAPRLTALEEDLLEVVQGLIEGMRDDGALVEADGSPYKGHRVGCECEVCQGALLLALAEGHGRCVLCACTDDAACATGCSWADGTHLICDHHPAKVIKAAQKLIARRLRG